MYSKLFLSLFLVAVLIGKMLPLSAQTASASIEGKIFNQEMVPVAFATVLLSSDSNPTPIKPKLSDANGEFIFEDIPEGTYHLKIESKAHSPFQKGPISLKKNENLSLAKLILSEKSIKLDSVEIVAFRSSQKLINGGVEIRIKDSPLAIGSNTKDLLPYLPGVMVNPNNDDIQVFGQSSVRVYINGRPSNLTGQDLMNLLKTLQANQVSSIKVITNPGPQYPAEGNVIIDIVLGKNVKLGANTSLNLGYAYGRYGKYDGAFSTSYRNSAFNAYASYGVGSGQNWEFIEGTRSQLATDFEFDTQTLTNYQNHNFRGGMDWFLAPKHTLGFQVNGIWGNDDLVTETYSENVNIKTGLIRDILSSRNENEGKRNQMNLNLNYQFQGTDGSSLNFDANYGKFDFQTRAFQPNTLYGPDTSQTIAVENFYSEAPNIIDIKTLQLDYRRPLWGGNFATGVKTANIKTDNAFSLYQVIQQKNLMDSTRSSSFLYLENVNAAYFSFGKQLGKVDFEIGLRSEHTKILGELTRVGEDANTPSKAVDSTYLSFFPSANINVKVNEQNTAQISYSRRIQRPDYQNLNPFEVRWSNNAFRWGNPFLKPQFVHNFQLTHLHKNSLKISLSYNETRDFMSQISDTLDDNSVFLTWINLDSRKIASANVYHTFKPIEKKTWSVMTNATISQAQNKVNLGPGKEVNLTYTSFTLFHQHTFSLPGKITMNLMGQYFSPSVWGANFEIKQRFQINAGLQKKILNQRANISLAMTDIFGTFGWRATQELGVLALDINGGGEFRQIKMSFSYLFGNEKMNFQKRDSRSEEAKRAKKTN